jgi:hypothetical protein
VSAAALPPVAPVIEGLLSSIYKAVHMQAVLARSFVQQGVDEADVPNQDIQFAFACLGDHDRVSVVGQLAPYWLPLTERALVFGNASGYGTPVLRLLLTMAPQLMAVSDLTTRLEHGPFLPAPSAMFRPVVRNARPIWGDPVRIDYQVTGVDYVRITPDDIFGRQALLRRIQGDTEKRYVELPGDDGKVVFTMLGKDGRIYGHTIELSVQRLSTAGQGSAA